MTRRFRLACKWVETVPVLTDPALARSFAELTITVGDQVITRHEASAGVRDAIFVPMLPIALWGLRSWNELFADTMPSAFRLRPSPHDALANAWEAVDTESDPDAHARLERELDRWERAHALRRTGDGLFLPDLLFQRAGADMLASWRAWDPSPDFAFLRSGRATVPVEDVVAGLRDLVTHLRSRIADVPRTSSGAAWLDELAPRGSADWTARGWSLLAERLGTPEAHFREWALGAGPDLAKAIADEYSVPAELIHDPVLLDSPVAMAFRSAASRLGDDDRATLKKRAASLASQAEALGLRDLRRDVLAAEEHVPEGVYGAYHRAFLVRRRRGASGKLEIEPTLRGLGVLVEDVRLDDPLTDGVSLWNDERALVLVNRTSPRASTPWGRRSLLAHELYHLLFDADGHAVFGEATGDGLRGPNEPLAGAFAAELLAPKAELPSFSAKLWTNLALARQTVQAVCSDFGVGRELALRQLQNRRQWPEPLIESLLSETTAA